MITLGIDVGTTGTKAIAVDENGSILGKGYLEYSLLAQANGWVEQNADDWWTAVLHAVREATASIHNKNEIRAIGVSTQGATMVAVDAHFRPLSNAITWMDTRATQECAELEEKIGKRRMYEKSGWALEADNDAPKIMWIRNHQPEIFQKASSFLSTLEFINWNLTGKNVIDPTNASIREMLNLEKLDWDEEILAAMGITKAVLPEIQPTGTCLGTLTPEAAIALGLSNDVMVYNGAHDQYCAALGCGALQAGDMLLSTGTTWVVLGISDHLTYSDSYIAAGIHPAKGMYGMMTSLRSAGSALKWYKSLISEESFAHMDEIAAMRQESAKNLYFLPFFAGAGFPHFDNSLHANLFGMELCHDKYDIALALMEGICFETKTMLQEYAASGVAIHRLKMMGGAAKSNLWCTLTGLITGCEITRMSETETCALGAAMLASVGMGQFPTYQTCAEQFVKSEKLPQSETSLSAFYQEKYNKYSLLFENLKGVNKIIW